MQEEDKTREARLRRLAKREGYIVKKSRAKTWTYDNQQGYMLITDRKVVAAGSRYELSLDDVERFLGR